MHLESKARPHLCSCLYFILDAGKELWKESVHGYNSTHDTIVPSYTHSPPQIWSHTIATMVMWILCQAVAELTTIDGIWYQLRCRLKSIITSIVSNVIHCAYDSLTVPTAWYDLLNSFISHPPIYGGYDCIVPDDWTSWSCQAMATDILP